LSTIDEYRNDVAILSSDDHTALFYGEIKAGLKKKGKPVPENDIWISVIALQYDLTLVTRDKHFETIDGLKIERW
jgi:tRNA(fMet)-specific endonuclease VapC